MPDTTPTAQKVKDCYELFIKYNGSHLTQIEREMRILGYTKFSRRIFYSRTERGVYKPGWIERFGWKSQLRIADCGLKKAQCRVLRHVIQWFAKTQPRINTK